MKGCQVEFTIFDIVATENIGFLRLKNRVNVVCSRVVNGMAGVLTQQLDRLVSRAAGQSSDGARLQLTSALRANPAGNFEHLCYHHARMLGTHWGLQTNSIVSIQHC